MKYRYALRNVKKICNKFGQDYYDSHIRGSLDNFFSMNIDLEAYEAASDWAAPNIKYPVILISDNADKDDMQLFAVLGTTYDVVRLAYIQRIKG